MVGLPAAHVIPPDWEAHHRPVSSDAMATMVRVDRLDVTGVRDSVSGVTTFADPKVVYEGPARVHAIGGNAAVLAADRVVTKGAYQVVLPADSDPAKVRDLVTVLACADPALVGLWLAVVDTPRPGLVWERMYGCDLHEPTVRR
jgi:hypothetical protein